MSFGQYNSKRFRQGLGIGRVGLHFRFNDFGRYSHQTCRGFSNGCSNHVGGSWLIYDPDGFLPFQYDRFESLLKYKGEESTS
jgi:hypothetical protein